MGRIFNQDLKNKKLPLCNSLKLEELLYKIDILKNAIIITFVNKRNNLRRAKSQHILE